MKFDIARRWITILNWAELLFLLNKKYNLENWKKVWDIIFMKKEISFKLQLYCSYFLELWKKNTQNEFSKHIKFQYPW